MKTKQWVLSTAQWIHRWVINILVILYGSLLCVLGMGGFEMELQCARCGMLVEPTDEAVERHDRAFHTDDN